MRPLSHVFRVAGFCRLLLGFVCLASSLRAQVPYLLHHQGRVVVSGINFNGTGQFRFALVNAAGDSTYWSNDGTVSGVPVQSVSLPVTQGYFSLYLGDTGLAGMRALSPDVFKNSDVCLRVWFDDGVHGNQPLGPIQRIAAVGYALMAEQVRPGAVDVDSLGGLTSEWRDLFHQPDFAQLRTKLGINLVDNTPDAAKPLSLAATTALDDKRSAVLELPRFKDRMLQIGSALRAGASTKGLYARLLVIGDSISQDLLLPSEAQLWRQSGFGGGQGGGLTQALTNVTTLSIANDPALQARWIRGEYLRINAGGMIACEPDRWLFPSGALLTGARFIYLRNTGSFKVRISPYGTYADAAYNNPVWQDVASVDTAGSGALAALDVTFPQAGLYRMQVLTTTGAPEIVSSGLLGAGGLSIDGSLSSGGKALANYASTPEPVWRDYLTVMAPDLIMVMFKNNGPTYNPDNLNWEAVPADGCLDISRVTPRKPTCS